MRFPRYLAIAAGLGGVVAAGALAGAESARRSAPPPVPWLTGDSVPRYAGDSLIRPEGFERWVLAGASMGLGYTQPSGADALASGGGFFHNVYIEPSAYQHYVRTGKFREKTMMAMTVFAPGERVHPSKRGFFEGDYHGLEIALKDSERFPGSWAYFNFGTEGSGSRAVALPREGCQACHARNAADDNVFVQFYPTLRKVSTKFDRGRP